MPYEVKGGSFIHYATSGDIGDGSIRASEDPFFDKRFNGKLAETLIHIVFPAATTSGAPLPVATYDTLMSVPHNLGRTPTQWTLKRKGIYQGSTTGPGDVGLSSDAPGDIYTDDPLPFTSEWVAFRCTKARTWAVIALR